MSYFVAVKPSSRQGKTLNCEAHSQHNYYAIHRLIYGRHPHSPDLFFHLTDSVTHSKAQTLPALAFLFGATKASDMHFLTLREYSRRIALADRRQGQRQRLGQRRRVQLQPFYGDTRHQSISQSSQTQLNQNSRSVCCSQHSTPLFSSTIEGVQHNVFDLSNTQL